MSREKLYMWLRMALPGDRFARENFVYRISVIWLHFTDWYGGYDLDTLIEERLIEPADLRYQPRGDWQDRFPPYSYRLTEKGAAVLRNPGLYIREGQWETTPKPVQMRGHRGRILPNGFLGIDED